ncbi:MAG: hypothetical protein QOH75_2806, partial [Actinomycetota bacterium]|nr:hypothetical protein [Actinomycetota bacterium]
SRVRAKGRGTVRLEGKHCVMAGGHVVEVRFNAGPDAFQTSQLTQG